MKKLILLIILALILATMTNGYAACEYTYETIWTGSAEDKITLIQLPDGFSAGQSATWDAEADLICSDGDNCATSEFFSGNYFDGTGAGLDYPPEYTKENFDVIRLTGDNTECALLTLFSDTCKSTDCGAADNVAMADVIHTLANQITPPVADCNFKTSGTCTTFYLVTVDNTSVPGGTQSGTNSIDSGYESWTSVGKNAGTDWECEMRHELSHLGLTNILGDEYNDVIAGAEQLCWGYTGSPGAAADGSINLVNGNRGDPNPPAWALLKWGDYQAGTPVESGAYCDYDVWNPATTSIMNGANLACDYDGVGIEAVNKGLSKRFGDTEQTLPTFTEVTVGGSTIAGQTLKGTITVTAAPTDASGIAFVELSVASGGDSDARHYYAGFDSTSPYTFEVDTTKWRDGSDAYVIAIAWDNNWNPKKVNPNFTIENKLLYAEDLTYEGAFKFPSGETRFGSSGLGWVPNGGDGTLVVVDTYDADVTDISIPVPLKDTAYLSLNAASVGQVSTDNTAYQGTAEHCVGLDDPYDCCTGAGTGCVSSLTSPRITGISYLPQQTGMTEDKLAYVLRNYYCSTPNCVADDNLGWSNVDFATSLDAAGNWTITDLGPAGIGSYIFYVEDTDWADTYHSSRYLATGKFRNAYADNYSCGPSMYLTAPWEECGGEPIDCENNPTNAETSLASSTVLFYDCDPENDPDKALDDIATGIDTFWNGGWVTYGSRSTPFFSAHKSGHRTEPPGDNYYYEPTYGWSGPDEELNDSKGYSGPPYYGTLLFYNPDDLQDTTTTWDQPYLWLQDVNNRYNQYEPGEVYASRGGGAAIDNTNGKIYWTEKYAYDSGVSTFNVVHEYTISADPGAADKVAPTDVSGVTKTSISKTSATISWDASEDRLSEVSYIITVNRHPTFMTDEVSLIHANYEYYVAPVRYGIEAWDTSTNKSTEVITTITGADGGNEPIMFVYPGEFSTTHYSDNWPNSHAPHFVNGEAGSVTPVIYGADTPYTFSLISGTLPTGLTLDEDTGVISGTPSAVKAGDTYDIKLTDSDGDVFIRRTVIWSGSSATCDHDKDGYQLDDGGGACTDTDSDDWDSRVNDGNPTFTTPTGIAIDGNTLSWTMSEEAKLYAYKVYSGDSSGNLPNEKFVGFTDSVDVSGYGDIYFAVTAIDYRGLESTESSEVQGNESSSTKARSGSSVKIGAGSSAKGN